MTQLNTQLSPLPCHFLRPNVSTALSFRRPASCNDATQVVIVRLGALKTMTMKIGRYVTSCGLVDMDGRFRDSYLHYWRRYTNVLQEPAASYRGRHIDVSEKPAACIAVECTDVSDKPDCLCHRLRRTDVLRRSTSIFRAGDSFTRLLPLEVATL